MIPISRKNHRIGGRYLRPPPKERSACHDLSNRGPQASHRYLQSQSGDGEVRSLSTQNAVGKGRAQKEQSTRNQRSLCTGSFRFWAPRSAHTLLAFTKFLPLSGFENSNALADETHAQRIDGLLVDCAQSGSYI